MIIDRWESICQELLKIPLTEKEINRCGVYISLVVIPYSIDICNCSYLAIFFCFVYALRTGYSSENKGKFSAC